DALGRIGPDVQPDRSVRIHRLGADAEFGEQGFGALLRAEQTEVARPRWQNLSQKLYVVREIVSHQHDHAFGSDLDSGKKIGLLRDSDAVGFREAGGSGVRGASIGDGYVPSELLGNVDDWDCIVTRAKYEERNRRSDPLDKDFAIGQTDQAAFAGARGFLDI